MQGHMLIVYEINKFAKRIPVQDKKKIPSVWENYFIFLSNFTFFKRLISAEDF